MLGLLDTASSVLGGGGLGSALGGGGTPEMSSATVTQTVTTGAMDLGKDSTWIYIAIGLAALLILSRRS